MDKQYNNSLDNALDPALVGCNAAEIAREAAEDVVRRAYESAGMSSQEAYFAAGKEKDSSGKFPNLEKMPHIIPGDFTDKDIEDFLSKMPAKDMPGMRKFFQSVKKRKKK